MPDEYALGTTFDYARHRIMNGVPEGSVDMAESIPFERNVDIMGGGALVVVDHIQILVTLPRSGLP